MVCADTIADNSRSEIYQVRVLSKHLTRGRHTSFYLDVEPWGPFPADGSRMTVTSRVYFAIHSGDRICLGLHAGLLNVAWYQQTPCTATAASSP